MKGRMNVGKKGRRKMKIYRQSKLRRKDPKIRAGGKSMKQGRGMTSLFGWWHDWLRVTRSLADWRPDCACLVHPIGQRLAGNQTSDYVQREEIPHLQYLGTMYFYIYRYIYFGIYHEARRLLSYGPPPAFATMLLLGPPDAVRSRCRARQNNMSWPQGF